MTDKKIDDAIKKGLRGTLESSNLFTNNLFINLIMDSKDLNSQGEIITDYKGYRVIPTTVINEECGEQKTIDLQKVKFLSETEGGVTFEKLRAEIDKYTKNNKEFIWKK